ncbi:MAG: PAS domain S-box protein, partial [Pseudomonadota bacterium]
MQVSEKTREQLIEELEEMRRRLERIESARAETEEATKGLSQSDKRYRSLFEDSLDGIFDVAADGTILDANDRNRPRQSLQIAEENYRELVEQTNSIILRWDKKGDITFLNNFGLNFFGYSANEILGRNVVGTIVPETDRSGKDLDMMIQNIFDHPKLYLKNQNENMKSNGERVWISWTNRPIYDEDGALKEILSIGNDHTELKNAEEELRKTKEELEIRVFERTATLQKTSERLEAELVERKKTEEALEESRNLLKVILESLPVGILYVDREERIVLANRIFASWWGKPDEDLAGHTVEDILDEHYHAVTDSI